MEKIAKADAGQRAVSPLAGKPAPASILVDLARLERRTTSGRRIPDEPSQLVSFGTSGHRGSPFRGSFTEAHIAAITQAICDYRRGQGIDGPLYMGKDTHALSEPAQRTALEVLAANGVETIIQRDDGVTPTPVISRAILAYNRGRTDAPGGRHRDHALAQSAGGRRLQVQPAQRRPGGHRRHGVGAGPGQRSAARPATPGCKRDAVRGGAVKAATTHQEDFVLPYVEDLRNVVDMDAIRGAGLTLGVDPLGGAARAVLGADQRDLRARHHRRQPGDRSDVLVHDGGSRRQDPHGLSSPYAMARLVELKDRFQVAFANDPDADRHGIVTRSAGLMNPNHYLAVAIRYLLTHRPRVAGARRRRQDAGQQRPDRSGGRASSAAGSTRCRWASSGSCRVCSTARAASAARRAPAPASCGATARCGRPTRTARSWTCWRPRSPPGPARIPASTTGSWRRSSARPYYTRIDAPATPEQKARLQKLSPEDVKADDAGRRADHRQADPGAGQRRADRRPEDRDRRAGGSRPARPAPRTSTRSTRRASGTRRTSTRWSRGAAAGGRHWGLTRLPTWRGRLREP